MSVDSAGAALAVEVVMRTPLVLLFGAFICLVTIPPAATTAAPPARCLIDQPGTPLAIRPILAHSEEAAPSPTSAQPGSTADADNDQPPRSGWGHFVWWVGHFHPAMTVFPIGLLLAAAVAELLWIFTRAAWLEGAARFCVLGAAVGGVITAPLGWAFAAEHGRSWVLETHRWLGTAGAAWLVLLAVVSEVSRRRPGGPWRGLYRAGLFLAVPAVAATGYFGGAMVYGLHEYDWQPRGTTHAGAAPATATAAPAGGAAATVTMTDDMTFRPAAVTVPAGTTVRWTNPSQDAHTVTADPQKASDAKDVALPAGVGPFDSGKVKPGGTFEHTFTTPGRFKFVCLPHEAMGMTGEVVVTPGR